MACLQPSAGPDFYMSVVRELQDICLLPQPKCGCQGTPSLNFDCESRELGRILKKKKKEILGDFKSLEINLKG